MNKKLVLFVLPALMALSSCSALGHTNVQPKDAFFKEEADACVELFGGNEDAIEFKRMTPLRSTTEDMVKPKVGVQYRAKYQNPGDAAWYVAVRFIAEIKTLDVNVTWTRSVYQANGTMLGSETSTVTTKAYTSLNSNSEDITPSSGYNYFVAYTLKDIPFESYDNYSIVAYVTLTDTISPAVQAPVASKAMIARIGGGASAAFDVEKADGYFMYGKIGGTEKTEFPADSPTRNSGSNIASFTPTLSANDTFVIVNKDSANSKFQIWGSSCLDYSGNDSEGAILTDFQDSDGLIKAKNAGKYALYLNKDSSAHLYRFKYVPSGLYVRGDAAGDADWGLHDEYQFTACPSEDGNIGVLLNVHLGTAAKGFKIGDADWDNEWGYYGFTRDHGANWKWDSGGYTISGGASTYFFGHSSEGGGSKNIVCSRDGYYNIYITNEGNLSFEIA